MVDRVRRNILERQKKREEGISDFANEIERFMVKNIPAALEEIRKGNLPPAEAAKLLLQLDTELRRLGLDEVMENIATIYGDELKLLREQWRDTANKDLVYTETDLENIETLVTFETTSAYNNVRANVDSIRAAVFREIIAGVEPDLNMIVSTNAEITKNQLQTELNTNVAAFQRSITVSKGEDLGITHYLYSGGLIKTSREFCRERDGNIYTIDEIMKWDNEQGLPADIYLGGYNCRHELLPIDKATAERLGLDTSKF